MPRTQTHTPMEACQEVDRLQAVVGAKYPGWVVVGIYPNQGGPVIRKMAADPGITRYWILSREGLEPVFTAMRLPNGQWVETEWHPTEGPRPTRPATVGRTGGM